MELLLFKFNVGSRAEERRMMADARIDQVRRAYPLLSPPINSGPATPPAPFTTLDGLWSVFPVRGSGPLEPPGHRFHEPQRHRDPDRLVLRVDVDDEGTPVQPDIHLLARPLHLDQGAVGNVLKLPGRGL